MTRFIRITKPKFHFSIGNHLQIKKTEKTNLKILDKLICLEFQNNIFHICKVKKIRSHFYIIEDDFNIQKKTSIKEVVSVNYINELIKKF